MNESFWVAGYSQILELALRVVALGAVVLLVLETVYLLIFTVFFAQRTGQRKAQSRKHSAENVAP